MKRPIRLQALFMLLLLLGNASLSAQVQADSIRTLSVSQLLEMVRRYHPVTRGADILVEKAKADVTIAQAGFDPLLYNSTAQKTFDGTDYYYYNRPQLTIPTWFGIEVVAGTEFLSGSRTDNSDTKGETSYFGLQVPLAKNLLMDKRRAALQTARIYRTASQSEKNNILNNLLLDALNTYWNWTYRYEVYAILNDAVRVNERRFAMVRTTWQQGDRPAIDTTEALVQLQQFQLLRSQALLEFRNTGLELSAFLWTGNDQPFSLPEDVMPDEESRRLRTASLATPVLEELLEQLNRNHPELQLYQFKLDVLGIEKKLKFQDLLPTANFRYNQLGKGYDILKTARGPLFENNFQYGITLGLPLRLSQGRGEYRKARLKITETRLQLQQKQWEMGNKVRMYFNELQALREQINLQERAYQSYLALQRGEEIRYFNGESSLFLINSRENKSLESLQKLTELKAKYFKAYNGLLWSAGSLR